MPIPTIARYTQNGKKKSKYPSIIDDKKINNHLKHKASKGRQIINDKNATTVEGVMNKLLISLGS